MTESKHYGEDSDALDPRDHLIEDPIRELVNEPVLAALLVKGHQPSLFHALAKRVSEMHTLLDLLASEVRKQSIDLNVRMADEPSRCPHCDGPLDPNP